MSALIDVTKLRDMFYIQSGIADGRLTPAIAAASRRLKGWVGASAYADAGDQDRQADLQYAEAHLAMHFALLGINTHLTHRGVVKTEKAEGDVVLSYLGPAEMQQLAQQYLEQAEEIAAPYLLSDATTNADMAVIEDE